MVAYEYHPPLDENNRPKRGAYRLWIRLRFNQILKEQCDPGTYETDFSGDVYRVAFTDTKNHMIFLLNIGEVLSGISH